MFQNRSPLMVAFGGMVIMGVVMGIGRFVYTPILPFMISADALDRSGAGLVAGSNYIGYLLGALIAGSSRLTMGRRKVMFAGAFFSLLTTALMAVTGNFTLFVLIRFVSGLASAFAMIYISSIVFDLATRTGKSYLSAIQFSGVGLGITISAFTLSVISPETLQWQHLWTTAAVLSLIGIIIGFLGIGTGGPVASQMVSRRSPDNKPDEQSKGENHLPNPKMGQALLLLIFGYGLFGFGYIITTTFISELAASTPSLAETSNIVWLVVGISATLLTYPMTLLAEKFGNLKTYAIFCLVEAIGVGLSVLILHPVAILIAAVLLGGTFIAITVVGLRSANALVAKIKKQEAVSSFGKWDERIAVALMTASFGTGQAIGPVLAGFLFELYGDLLIASLCAVAALLIAGLLAVVVDQMSKPPKSGYFTASNSIA